ncbi:MAG: hypothetical protein LUG18_06755 [Candidatus Azobacteroides sp.]|nr:hypothetical protein [Candidatus Azobacteroides sp.]
MENELTGQKTIERITDDLKKIIKSNQPGKISLGDYIPEKENTGCMDFAMLYEADDDLRAFINDQKIKGKKIIINEQDISIL